MLTTITVTVEDTERVAFCYSPLSEEERVLLTHNDNLYAVSKEFGKTCEGIRGFIDEGVSQPIPIMFDTNGDTKPLKTIIYMIERSLEEKVDQEEKITNDTPEVKYETDLLNEYNHDDTLATPYDDLVNMTVYLGANRLSHVVGRYIRGRYIKGKSVEFMRKAFAQEDDLTPEEKKQILEENPLLTPVETPKKDEIC